VEPEILAYYDRGAEQARLTGAPSGRLELVRTQVLLERLLPAAVADIGGGAGAHALSLAGRGYDVHLLDPVPLHVEQARAAGLEHASGGDARAPSLLGASSHLLAVGRRV
jgi:2-polyprenyl-3-methyl-5-hydroxy-6-metoxy-1,4-benzoquinol methylase